MPDIARKLLIRPNHRVAVLNAPGPVGSILGELPEGAVASEQGAATADAVILFVANRGELDRLSTQLPVDPERDPVIWIAYPKLSSRKGSDVTADLNRDVIARVIETTGLRVVSNVAIDETWSALRLRPPARVGTSKA
jgi:hypothetical protein